MRWLTVPIGSDQGKHHQVNGLVAECTGCGRREWWAFRLEGLAQLYLQCLHCDRIESPDGQANLPVEVWNLQTNDGGDVVHPLSAPGQEVGS